MVTDDSKEYLDDFGDAKISDSFGEDMDQLYNDHKKDAQVQPFEMQNSQRPVSKYQRDRIGSAKRDPSPSDDILNIEEFYDKINACFNNHQITQNDFCDNIHIFISKDELKDLFKKSHYNLTMKELDYLFTHKNPNLDSNYISCATLIKEHNISFYSPEDISRIKSTNQSDMSITNLRNNAKTKEEINAEFNLFKKDILLFVDKEARQEKSIPSSAKLKQIPQKKPSTAKPKKVDPVIEEVTMKEEKKEEKKDEKKKPTNYLWETLNKKMIEEDMTRLAIEKKNKEFQRDCVKKMVEANEYAEILKINKTYSAYAEEHENALVCRVFDKDTRDYIDIELKQFLIEFKKLKKAINQMEERQKYMESKTKKDNGDHQIEFFKKSRKEKHEILSNILRESLELKVQLRKQLKALRDKNLIDVSIINKNLKLTNLDEKKKK